MKKKLELEIVSMLERAIALRVTPGCVVSLLYKNQQGEFVSHTIAQGNITYEKNAAHTGPDVWYDLASVTKLFTALTVLRLVECGYISLAQTVGSYLDREMKYPNSWIHSTSVRDVLEYKIDIACEGTGELSSLMIAGGMFAFFEKIIMAPLKPGHLSVGVYSNVPAFILRCLVEKVAKKNFDVCVREYLLAPLGVEDHIAFSPPTHATVAPTCTEVTPGFVHDTTERTARLIGAHTGIAGLFATSEGMMIIARALLTNSCNGTQLFTDDIYALLSREQRSRFLLCGSTLGLQTSSLLWGDDPVSGKIFGFSGFTGTTLGVHSAHAYAFSVLANRTYGRTDEEGAHESRDVYEKKTRRAIVDAIQIPLVSCIEKHISGTI